MSHGVEGDMGWMGMARGVGVRLGGGVSHGVRHEGPCYGGLRREVDDCFIIVRFVRFVLFRLNSAWVLVSV